MNDKVFPNDLAFRFDHAMLPVSNLDRSIDFYTRLLGMTAMERAKDTTRGIAKCHVGYGERGAVPTIELIQKLADPPAAIARAGHLCLYVSDLTRLCAALTRAETRFIEPLTVSGPDRRRVSAWIADPDGHVIELVESRAG